MNRNQLKNYLSERKKEIYNSPCYKKICALDYTLYDPEYQQNNYQNFAFFQSQQDVNSVTLVTHNKMYAKFNENDLLCKLQNYAKMQNQIVVPAKILHWRRRQMFAKKYYAFQASKSHYIVMPERELNENERCKYIDYIRLLDWNTHLP